MRTFHRIALDRCLEESIPFISGSIIDIGGKKTNKRGKFCIESFGIYPSYVNIDESTQPDFVASIYNLPFDDQSFKNVLLCEVLEHLQMPESGLDEVSRIIKRNGLLILSMPFLYRIHADPSDFQRWTIEKLNQEKGGKTFQVVTIWGVITLIENIKATNNLRF